MLSYKFEERSPAIKLWLSENEGSWVSVLGKDELKDRDTYCIPDI